MSESNLQITGMVMLASLFIFFCRTWPRQPDAIQVSSIQAEVKLTPADDLSPLSKIRAFID